MSEAYLTIDDSPSETSFRLIDYLAQKKIPALLFCRGDKMEQDPESILYAIRYGLVIGNHSYSHRPGGLLSFEDIIEEISRTDRLIDKAYAQAKVGRPGRYFRFPYLDRGCGDRVEQRFDDLIVAIRKGESIRLAASDDALEAKKERIQDWLKAQGFVQPFHNIDHPLYQVPDIANACDCFMTYSAFDWMLAARHKGQWPWKTIDDLKRKIDEDFWLQRPNSRNIVLLHDSAEIFDVTTALIDHMLAKDIQFQPYTE